MNINKSYERINIVNDTNYPCITHCSNNYQFSLVFNTYINISVTKISSYLSATRAFTRRIIRPARPRLQSGRKANQNTRRVMFSQVWSFIITLAFPSYSPRIPLVSSHIIQWLEQHEPPLPRRKDALCGHNYPIPGNLFSSSWYVHFFIFIVRTRNWVERIVRHQLRVLAYMRNFHRTRNESRKLRTYIQLYCPQASEVRRTHCTAPRRRRYHQVWQRPRRRRQLGGYQHWPLGWCELYIVLRPMWDLYSASKFQALEMSARQTFEVKAIVCATHPQSFAAEMWLWNDIIGMFQCPDIKLIFQFQSGRIYVPDHSFCQTEPFAAVRCEVTHTRSDCWQKGGEVSFTYLLIKDENKIKGK